MSDERIEVPPGDRRSPRPPPFSCAVADILPVTFEGDLLADPGIVAPTVVPEALRPGAERTAKGGAAARGAEH